MCHDPRSAPTTSTTTSLNSTRTVPQSPLVKRLQKQLAELDSYNARPPPVLSRPQSARESEREHRSAPCPRLTAPRASTTIAAHNHAKIEVPANRTPRCNLEISDSDWLLIETLVAKAEARLGVHTALDSSGRPARAPRIKRPLIGPPPRFDGRPTYVRSKAIGARLPASPAAAEILARINTYPPSPFDCEHHAGGAYVRRAPKLPRRTSDTPKAVREVDDRVSRRLGGTTYRVPPPSRRGEANVQDVAGGKDAQEHAARLGFEAIDSGRHLAWSALPPEVQQSARNLSAHIDAMADVAVEDGAETSVLVIRVSEQACGHVAYMVAAPEDLQLAQLALLEKAGAAHQQEVLAKEEQARLAESVKEIGGSGAFEASAFRRASKIVSWGSSQGGGTSERNQAAGAQPVVESVRLKKRMKEIERKVERQVSAVCKYSEKINNAKWLARSGWRSTRTRSRERV